MILSSVVAIRWLGSLNGLESRARDLSLEGVFAAPSLEWDTLAEGR